ncbi:hypothetical protein EVAR_14042_1 [Eumeta japonica]|uniref:Uncharacterized protein n=1 Tax=Eumeta variegata TaxID=151549 RepID=A0A4C1UPT2_EUMVA|nr:hypothetical protein EVAR_14042_1 [Eumeta japonica]
MGHSFVSLYHEPRSSDVVLRRHYTCLTQIESKTIPFNLTALVTALATYAQMKRIMPKTNRDQSEHAQFTVVAIKIDFIVGGAVTHERRMSYSAGGRAGWARTPLVTANRAVKRAFTGRA